MSSPTAASSALPPMALVAALAAAFAGALAWGGIAYVAELELGYAAWGIGLLVGFAVVRLGGRGAPIGVLAAALTLASIFGGKLLAQELFLERAITEAMAPDSARPMYDEHLVDARGWSELSDPSDDDEVREYMVAHRFTEAEDAATVHPSELAAFRRFAVPMLERSAAEAPSFEDWHALATAEAQAQIAAIPRLDALADSLGSIDLVFAFFAIATAFGMVARAPTPTPPQISGADTAATDHEHRRAA